MSKVAIFVNLTMYNNIKTLGPLPSGVELGTPITDATGRCASVYAFTETDQSYLMAFGVQIMNSLPEDWQWPE